MDKPQLTFNFYGTGVVIVPVFGTYENGRTAIDFETLDGEPFGTLTVNVPDANVPDGQILVKDWSENEPLYYVVRAAGWTLFTGRDVPVGPYGACAKSCRMAGPLLDAFNAYKNGK